MSARFLAAAYSRRPLPKKYDPDFLNVELGRIAKAMPSYVIRSVTASTNLQINDGMLVCNATGGAITVTLMDPSLASGQPVTIKKSDATANAIVIGGTVDGTANRTLTNQNDSIVIQSDGTTWFRPMLTFSGDLNYSNSIFTVGALVVDSSRLDSTNLLSSPKDIGVAPWVAFDATVTSNSTTGPDGTLTADTLTDAAAYGVGGVYQPITGTGGSQVTMSISLKFIVGSSIDSDFGIYDATAGSWMARATVRWVAGVATSISYPAGSATTFPIINEGDGWYRVGFTTTGTWTVGHTIRAYVYPAWVGTSGGGTIYVWDVRCYTAVNAIAVIGPVSITGTMAVSGALTLSAAPTLSTLSASLPVVTNASKQLSSATVTGTGTTVVMSVSPTITGTALIAGITYSTALGSLTAYATPAAFTQTLSSQFASTVSGATLMGYGTTGDVTLKSRSGSDALYVVANSVNVRAKGSLTSDAAAGGIGYATGAGGTVAQGAGSGKATAFTLSKVTGQITTDGANLAADTTVSATWTNTAIAATDVVAINHLSGGTIGAYSFNVQCGAGTATLSITNRSVGALAEALVLSFVVLKGVTA